MLLLRRVGEVEGEAEAVVQRGMGVEPEDDEPGGIGIFEVFLAKNLKRAGGYLVSIGDEGLNDLEAVDVCGVFLPAAEGIADGRAEKAHNIQEQ